MLLLPAQGRSAEGAPGPSGRHWSSLSPPRPRGAAIGPCRGPAACDSSQRILAAPANWLRGWSEDSETRADSQSSASPRSCRRGDAGARDGVTGRGSRMPGVAVATKLRVLGVCSALARVSSACFTQSPGENVVRMFLTILLSF